MSKITSDEILNELKAAVEAGKALDTDYWLDAAFRLNLILADDHAELEDLRSVVAQKKLEILKGQEKRNVSEAELEVEASADYKIFRLQQHKVDRIEEFIRVAKKNASQY